MERWTDVILAHPRGDVNIPTHRLEHTESHISLLERTLLGAEQAKDDNLSEQSSEDGSEGESIEQVGRQ